jgi:hypothetical protein
MNTVKLKEGNSESATFIHQSGYIFIDFYGCKFEQGSRSSLLMGDVRVPCDVRADHARCGSRGHGMVELFSLPD